MHDGDELHSASDIHSSALEATLAGSVMGTPQYMSPEQARGENDSLDERSDVYSLGGILYALLRLRPPVEGQTLDEVLNRVTKGEITAPSQLQSPARENGDGGFGPWASARLLSVVEYGKTFIRCQIS